MRRSPDIKLFHQDSDNGSGPENYLPASKSNAESQSHKLVPHTTHLFPALHSRTRRLIHQHVHYSAGPIILLWDELDETITSAEELGVYEDDTSDFEQES